MSLKNNAQAIIEDVDKAERARPVVLDVNFSEDYKDCVKITIPSKNPFDKYPYSAIVKYSDLFAFMFTLANKEQQAKMIPVREEIGTEYMKQIRVKCKKDMKEGEELVVNVKIHVPSVIEEQILKDLKTPYLTEENNSL